MFYKRQYKIDSETFAWLGSAWGLCSFFSQLLLVPFLSFTLGIRDTTTTIIVIIVQGIIYHHQGHHHPDLGLRLQLC